MSTGPHLDVDGLCEMGNAMARPLKCITGALIASFDPGVDPVSGMDLWTADGRILALLPAGSPAPAEGPVEALAFERALVMPGMINAHTHSSSVLTRGTTGGLPLDLHLMEAMTRRASMSLSQVRTSILRFGMEMLKSGVTGVVDHFACGRTPSVEAVSSAFSAYAEIGMRAAVAPMYQDIPYVDSLPIDIARLPPDLAERWRSKKPVSPESYFAVMEEVVKEWGGRSNLKVLTGVEGPQRCTPRLLEMTGDFIARHGIGNHTHLLESKTQALMVPPDCDGSFVAYLDRFGLINPKSSLAHFVWCTERDIELSAERGVNVVNNPFNNLHLGSGIQPTARLLEAGINVALGTDGVHGTNASLFEKARLSALLSRVCEVDNTRWIRAGQALRMATVNGAAVLNEPGNLGTIRIGAYADLAILDLTTPVYRPMGDLLNHLVMFETGSSVDTVLVNGEVVVRHGRCTRINEEEVLAAADEAAEHNHATNIGSVEAGRTECQAFEPLIVEALKRNAPINRFAALS
jgi:5-methylthioadenosine/S-adenosylhomocysteine deaminase